MIVAACLNIALDVTYHVERFVPGQTHRAASVGERAGGKGLNVARVLQERGADVLVAGFIGGRTGELVGADLAAAGIRAELTAVRGETRRCITVVDPHGATVVNEPGPVVGPDEWQQLLDAAQAGWAGADVVVLSGSAPRGLPDDAYGQLVAIAHDHGARTVLDAEGVLLTAALPAGPDVVKPNAVEAAAALQRPVDTVSDAVGAGQVLCAMGAGAAVLSRGADGLVAVTDAGTFSAGPPRPIAGNPTGAGDALAAALADGMARGHEWPDMLRDGVATSAAAAALPYAGAVDRDLRDALLGEVSIEEV